MMRSVDHADAAPATMLLSRMAVSSMMSTPSSSFKSNPPTGDVVCVVVCVVVWVVVVAVVVGLVVVAVVVGLVVGLLRWHAANDPSTYAVNAALNVVETAAQSPITWNAPPGLQDTSPPTEPP